MAFTITRNKKNNKTSRSKKKQQNYIYKNLIKFLTNIKKTKDFKFESLITLFDEQ